MLFHRILNDNQGRDVLVFRKIYKISYLYAMLGFGPGYYLDAGLSRRDLTMTFKKGFYSQKLCAKRVSELHDPRCSKLPQNPPRTGETCAFGAFARAGRSGALVDNVGAGGTWTVAEIHTGRLGLGRRPNVNVDFAVHLNNAAPIAGVTVPFCNEAKEIACRAIVALLTTRYFGVDVAFTAEGPIIIEVNNKPDYIDFAILGIPSQVALKG